MIPSRRIILATTVAGLLMASPVLAERIVAGVLQPEREEVDRRETVEHAGHGALAPVDGPADAPRQG